jgi:pimeloyl-ACP methyl ester carboxylesterase
MTIQRTTDWFGGLAGDVSGRPDGRPPVLLLHGLTFDRTMWRPILDELHAIDPDRHVLAIDLPGHGESPDASEYRLDGIEVQLDAVLAAAGMVSPVIVGHSAGAIAGTVFASRRPSAGVVNVDQGLDVETFAPDVRQLAPQLRGPAFAQVWEHFAASMHAELLPEPAAALVRSTSRPRQEVVLGYWAEILDGDLAAVVALRDAALLSLRASDVPYAVVAGSEPGPAYRAWLAARLPQATITAWPGSGHFPHLARPDAFARLLASTGSDQAAETDADVKSRA